MWNAEYPDQVEVDTTTSKFYAFRDGSPTPVEVYLDPADLECVANKSGHPASSGIDANYSWTLRQVFATVTKEHLDTDDEKEYALAAPIPSRGRKSPRGILSVARRKSPYTELDETTLVLAAALLSLLRNVLSPVQYSSDEDDEGEEDHIIATSSSGRTLQSRVQGLQSVHGTLSSTESMLRSLIDNMSYPKLEIPPWTDVGTSEESGRICDNMNDILYFARLVFSTMEVLGWTTSTSPSINTASIPSILAHPLPSMQPTFVSPTAEPTTFSTKYYRITFWIAGSVPSRGRKSRKLNGGQVVAFIERQNRSGVWLQVKCDAAETVADSFEFKLWTKFRLSLVAFFLSLIDKWSKDNYDDRILLQEETQKKASALERKINLYISDIEELRLLLDQERRQRAQDKVEWSAAMDSRIHSEIDKCRRQMTQQSSDQLLTSAMLRGTLLACIQTWSSLPSDGESLRDSTKHVYATLLRICAVFSNASSTNAIVYALKRLNPSESPPRYHVLGNVISDASIVPVEAVVSMANMIRSAVTNHVTVVSGAKSEEVKELRQTLHASSYIDSTIVELLEDSSSSSACTVIWVPISLDSFGVTCCVMVSAPDSSSLSDKTRCSAVLESWLMLRSCIQCYVSVHSRTEALSQRNASVCRVSAARMIVIVLQGGILRRLCGKYFHRLKRHFIHHRIIYSLHKEGKVITDDHHLQKLERAMADWSELVMSVSGCCGDAQFLGGTQALWADLCGTLISQLSSAVSLRGCGLVVKDGDALVELRLQGMATPAKQQLSGRPVPGHSYQRRLSRNRGVVEHRSLQDHGCRVVELCQQLFDAECEDEDSTNLDGGERYYSSAKIWRLSRKESERLENHYADEQMWLVPLRVSFAVVGILRITLMHDDASELQEPSTFEAMEVYDEEAAERIVVNYANVVAPLFAAAQNMEVIRIRDEDSRARIAGLMKMNAQSTRSLPSLYEVAHIISDAMKGETSQDDIEKGPFHVVKLRLEEKLSTVVGTSVQLAPSIPDENKDNSEPLCDPAGNIYGHLIMGMPSEPAMLPLKTEPTAEVRGITAHGNNNVRRNIFGSDGDDPPHSEQGHDFPSQHRKCIASLISGCVASLSREIDAKKRVTMAVESLKLMENTILKLKSSRLDATLREAKAVAAEERHRVVADASIESIQFAVSLLLSPGFRASKASSTGEDMHRNYFEKLCKNICAIVRQSECSPVTLRYSAVPVPSRDLTKGSRANDLSHDGWRPIWFEFDAAQTEDERSLKVDMESLRNLPHALDVANDLGVNCVSKKSKSSVDIDSGGFTVRINSYPLVFEGFPDVLGVLQVILVVDGKPAGDQSTSFESIIDVLVNLMSSVVLLSRRLDFISDQHQEYVAGSTLWHTRIEAADMAAEVWRQRCMAWHGVSRTAVAAIQYFRELMEREIKSSKDSQHRNMSLSALIESKLAPCLEGSGLHIRLDDVVGLQLGERSEALSIASAARVRLEMVCFNKDEQNSNEVIGAHIDCDVDTNPKGGDSLVAIASDLVDVLASIVRNTAVILQPRASVMRQENHADKETFCNMDGDLESIKLRETCEDEKVDDSDVIDQVLSVAVAEVAAVTRTVASDRGNGQKSMEHLWFDVSKAINRLAQKCLVSDFHSSLLVVLSSTDSNTTLRVYDGSAALTLSDPAEVLVMQGGEVQGVKSAIDRCLRTGMSCEVEEPSDNSSADSRHLAGIDSKTIDALKSPLAASHTSRKKTLLVLCIPISAWNRFGSVAAVARVVYTVEPKMGKIARPTVQSLLRPSLTMLCDLLPPLISLSLGNAAGLARDDKMEMRLNEAMNKNNKLSTQLSKTKRLHRVVGRAIESLMKDVMLSADNKSEGNPTIQTQCHPATLHPQTATVALCSKLLDASSSCLDAETRAIMLKYESSPTESADAAVLLRVMYRGTAVTWRGVPQNTMSSPLPASGADGKSIVEYAMANLKSVVLDDASHDSRYCAEIDGILDENTPYLVVPIRDSRDEAIGALMFSRKSGRSNFGAEELIVAETISYYSSLSFYWCSGLWDVFHRASKSEARIELLETSLRAKG